MAGFADLFKGIFSRNVAQAVNKASNEGQFGFFNFNQVQSSDKKLEKNIVENVASYGKQLGQVIDALQVVIAQGDLKEKIEEFDELRIFYDLAENITAAKRIRNISKNEAVIECIVADMLCLKEHNAEAYKALLKKLGLREIDYSQNSRTAPPTSNCKASI